MEFVNKFEDDLDDFAIEVLIDESGERRDSKKDEACNETYIEEDTVPNSSLTEAMAEDLPSAERIRINSPQILSVLAYIDKNIDASIPNVMLSPFKFLVHYEQEIRNSFLQLDIGEDVAEPKSSEDEGIKLNVPNEDSSSGYGHQDPRISHSHMRCLIEFMDKYVMPIVLRWRTNQNGKIRFRDLWHIFKPGEDIFMPIKERYLKISFDAPAVTPDRFHGLYQLMWRVTGSGGGRQDLSILQHRNAQRNTHDFRVNCYHIDFDGKYFTPIVHTFSIGFYKGTKDIISLSFFPIRFLEQAQKIQTESFAQGKQVFDAIVKSHTHFYYVGPTMTRQPRDCPLLADNETLHSEHLESEVIVDYRAALLEHPSWAPKLSPWKQPPTQPSEVQDGLRIRYWNDRRKSKLMRTELDHVYNDNLIDKERALAFKSSEGIFNPFPSAWLSNERLIQEKDIAMLAARVFAFVLRTRTFAPLWLWGLESIKPQNDSLRNLQLRNSSYKDTIHALVRTHFLQKHARQNSGGEQDAIRGKGKGLIFLLHGAPGVGKTFTAESVAAANGRPLFQITCGDLGLSPNEVEKALTEIFRFAQLWDCVLLLDECDIFLTQRTKNDLTRNSLVSVFLRALEFYMGVLSLTTNRVGSLDSAVKSRITWSTYYPPLDLKQTKEIWKVNLDLLAKRNPNVHIDRSGILAFAKEQFQTTIGDGNNWNGRQIQNAFKVAMALADWDAYSSEEQRSMDTKTMKPQVNREVELTSNHFMTVAAAVETFERYIQETTGRSEAQRAYDAQERADTFIDDQIAPDADSDPSFVTQEPSSKRRRISGSTAASLKHHQQPSTGGKYSQHRPSSTSGRSSAHQQKSSNSNGQARSRNSSSYNLTFDGPSGEPSVGPWTNGNAGLLSPHGALSSAAAAVMRMRPQSPVPSSSGGKKRGRTTPQDRKGSGSRFVSQREHFDSGSDVDDEGPVGGEDGGGGEGEAVEYNSDWE